jgi:hypothetical protein
LPNVHGKLPKIFPFMERAQNLIPLMVALQEEMTEPKDLHAHRRINRSVRIIFRRIDPFRSGLPVRFAPPVKKHGKTIHGNSKIIKFLKWKGKSDSRILTYLLRSFMPQPILITSTVLLSRPVYFLRL